MDPPKAFFSLHKSHSSFDVEPDDEELVCTVHLVEGAEGSWRPGGTPRLDVEYCYVVQGTDWLLDLRPLRCAIVAAVQHAEVLLTNDR